MAFKVLTQKELSFLNEDERKAYEEAYGKYLERVAFVKRLAELDKVKMPQVKLNKEPVKRIVAPEMNTRKLPTYKATASDSVSDFLNATKTAGSAFAAVGKLKPASAFSASLPDVKTKTPDKIGGDHDVSFKVKLTDIMVSVAPKTAKIEQRRFRTELPPISTDIKPYSKDVNIKPFSIAPTNDIQIASPKAVSFATGEKRTAVLSKIGIAAPGVISFHAGEKRTAVLPEIGVAPHGTVSAAIPPLKDVSLEQVKTVVPDAVGKIPNRPVVTDCNRFIAVAPNVDCTLPEIKTSELPNLKVSKATKVSFVAADVRANISPRDILVPKAPFVPGNITASKPDISSFSPVVTAPDKVLCEINVKKTPVSAPMVVATSSVKVNVAGAKVNPVSHVNISSPHVTVKIGQAFVKNVNAAKVAAPLAVTFENQDYTVAKTVLPDVKFPKIDHGEFKLTGK